VEALRQRATRTPPKTASAERIQQQP